MKRKAVLLLLCFSLLLPPVLQDSTVYSDTNPPAPEVSLVCDGLEVDHIFVAQDEKKELTAVCDPEDPGYGYQWQILADMEADLWADIQGQNEKSLDVSYSLTASLLDGSGSAYVRCVVTSDLGDFYSAPLCVTISFLPEKTALDSSFSISSMGPPHVLSGGASEYIYIQVNYLDAITGNSIYSPFTAKIENGSAFQQNIISPTFLGYAPYWNQSDPSITIPSDGQPPVHAPDSALALELDYDEGELTEDLTINVYYKAVDVPYGVKYFFQNINDDMYSENIGLYYTGLAKTGSIVSNEELESNAGNTDGFTALFYYPESIAADGSTIYECYYDRNYYLIMFNMDGGYGVEPIYARYDAPFSVNAPTRPGYVFAGWDLYVEENGGYDGVPDVIPGKIPMENRSYKAIWTTTTAQVTLVYWCENADDNHFSYWGKDTITATSATTINGEHYKALPSSIPTADRAYFTYLYADTNVYVEGDNSSVVNIYYSRNRYKINFKDNVNTTCKLEEHTHTDDCYVYLCGQDHAHTAQCIRLLNCRKTEHTHTTGCSSTGSGNYIFSITAKYEATVGDIWPTADDFPGRNFHGWTIESVSSTAVSKRINMTNDLCDTSDNVKIATAGFQNYSMVYLHYMFESFDQTSPANGNERRLYGSNFYDKSELYYQAVRSNGTFGLKQILGMSGMTSSAEVDGTNLFLYYSRNSYTLDLISFGVTLRTQSVKYEAPIAPYVDTFGDPPYPSTLEENAYEFAGWYTTPECFAGSEYRPDQTMPANNLALYAKWSPVTHTVRFFRTYDDMLVYESGINSGLTDEHPSMQALILESKTRIHGQTIGSVSIPADTSGFDYTFNGWFYMNAGKKSAFTPLDMPVNRSFNIFADWGSLAAQPYIIHYVLLAKEAESQWLALLQAAAGGNYADHASHTVTYDGETRTYVYLSDDDGWHRTVANDTIGFAYQGSTRTFLPKAGNPYNQLDSSYNNGYFPTLASHSITMQYEPDKSNPQHNVFTFTYVTAENIQYKIRYVDKNTGHELTSAVYPIGHEVKTTSSVVITERFRVYENYLPDSFYKRLILAVVYDPATGTYVGSDENEIIFYYTFNSPSAFYAVHYMLQKIGSAGTDYKTDGSGHYYESDSHMEGIADKGASIEIEPLAFSGFNFIPNHGVVRISDHETVVAANMSDPEHPKFTITISENGTELYIFYERNSYDYKVYYLSYGTDISQLETFTNATPGVLADIKSGSAEFGSVVIENAEIIDGMTCISSVQQSLSIRANTSQNVIIFYYAPLQYTVEYKVWDGGGGSVSRTIEVTEGASAFVGSEAAANTGYAFEGWYLDAACTKCAIYDALTNPEGKAELVGNTLRPIYTKLTPAPGKNTFYAKFSPQFGTLTISRDNTSDESNGQQTFVYKVASADDPSLTFYVTVTGSGSTTISGLLYGSYTVSQVNDWSWRYGDTQKNIDVSAPAGTSVVFGVGAGNAQWLSGNSQSLVNRKQVTP